MRQSALGCFGFNKANGDAISAPQQRIKVQRIDTNAVVRSRRRPKHQRQIDRTARGAARPHARGVARARLAGFTRCTAAGSVSGTGTGNGIHSNSKMAPAATPLPALPHL
jgi:hypothetical protein